MTALAGQLFPEMIGLMITPAAIVACLLLLDSSRPLRNVALFGSAFIAPYLVLSAAVVAGGSALGAQDSSSDTGAWVSVAIGVLFLTGGLFELLRGRRRTVGVVAHEVPTVGARATQVAAATSPPAWAKRLEEPDTRTVLVAGVALAVINPNIAILASGLTAVTTAAETGGQRVVGVVLLLGSCLLDFALPTLAFLVLGHRARVGLRVAGDWLVTHNRIIGIVVLLAFGVLFLVRGLLHLG